MLYGLIEKVKGEWEACALSERVVMTKTMCSICLGLSLLVSSVLFPVSPTFAQTPVPPSETRPPQTRLVEPRADRDTTGLWGLLGLVGLLGLAGLRRHTDPDRVRPDTATREQRRL